MMRVLFIVFLIQIFGFDAFAQSLQANIDHRQFYAPNEGSYLETYIVINGNSIVYKQFEANKFRGSIDVEIDFKKSGAIVKSKQYTISSPVLSDTSGFQLNFISQDRILLDSGKYEMEIRLFDQEKPENKLSANDNIEINHIGDQLLLSEIQQFDSLFKADEFTRFNKAGYDLIPYTSSFYPKEVDKLG